MTIEPPPAKAREAKPEGEIPAAAAPQCVKVAGHDVTVFVESPPLLDSMIRDIEGAKKRVWLETYIFFDDVGGRRVAEALKAKAREGVDVRVHYDAIGSAATPGSFFTQMQAAGVQVKVYHSFLEGLRRFRPLSILNKRNHRKVLVVDDTAGYFGGMNIIDNVEDVKQIKEENRPKSSGWRDVHLRLSGPQQCELAESFLRSWERRPKVRGSMSARLVQLVRLRRQRVEEFNGDSIRFFDSNGGRISPAARIYTRFIRSAKKQLTISMAYFIPVGTTLRALLAARKRHVQVRVVVPGESDVKIVQRATAHIYDLLIRRGIRVFERQHRMLHSKVMIVDENYTLVGSANLDPRSFYTNREFLAVIRSPALAKIMLDVCKFEISQSQRITMDECRSTTRWQRLKNRLAWSLRWWL